MRVAVVGLGKIGLPIAAQCCSKGISVVGCDINQVVVDSVNRGESHVKEEPGLAELIHQAHNQGIISATTQTAVGVSQSDVVIVIVPVIVDDDKKPLFSSIQAATREIAKGLKAGTTIIFETTLPVGYTRQLASLLEQNSDLQCGVDFYVAFSPERVNSGSILRDLHKYPKIVGGVNVESTQKGVSFYETILDTQIISVKNSETAEMIKLMGMMYRDVNIGLANEFALYANKKGVDIQEAIQICNTNPYSHILKPSIGVGGHCAPVYPYFMIHDGREVGSHLNLAERARTVNDSMAAYALQQIKDAIGTLEGKSILLVGLSYRENVKETAFSTTLDLITLLKNEKANFFIEDPLFTAEEIAKFGSPYQGEKVDVVILQAYHNQVKEKGLQYFFNLDPAVLFDGRGYLPRKDFDDRSIKYITI